MKGISQVDSGDAGPADGTAHMLDKQCVELLKYHGFTGPVYQEFTDELWAYALPVLKSKMRSGEIFKMCFERNVMVPAPTFDERAVLHSSMEDRDALAVDTIAAAVPRFRDTLVKGRWKQAGGSSLRTFFIGACLFAFAEVFSTWATARRRHLERLIDGEIDTLASQLISVALDPERNAVSRDTIEAILRRSPPATRTICALIMRDMSFAAIAKELGITERAVEGRMRRLRRRVNRMVEDGAVDYAGRGSQLAGASTEAIVA